MIERILVAHADADYVSELAEHMAAQQIEVVGPADCAAMALALAAIQPIDRAVVGRRLSGRRTGDQLARLLERDWGVQTTLIDRPRPSSLSWERQE